MRLPQKVLKIDTYVAPDEAFHFMRRDLPDIPPVFEHSHDFYELLLVEQGHVHHWVNGIEEVLEAGHLVFIRPQDRHTLHAAAGPVGRIMNVAFRVDTAQHLVERYHDDFSGRYFWQNGPLPTTLRLHGAQRERAVNAMLALNTSLRSLARIEHFLLSVMTHVLDAADFVDDRAPGWLIQACRAAREPRVFQQGVEGFVAAAGRSHEHVCRQARRHLGLSPTQYINRVRIQYAAMLLANTERQIQALATECGFENLSHFHRQFREQYGTTPLRYRQRHSARSPVASA